jgi:flagellar basal-body rod modification protein FlgD
VELTAADLRTASPRPSQANAFSALGSEEFVKIIFAELANQDPLAPSDSKALLQQLSSLRSIQSDTDLSARLGALVGQNELAAASNLIGRTVSGVSEELRRVEGPVASVSRTQAGATLTLKSGERIPMSRIDRVLGETPAPAGAAS